jgi:hypothetical protein
MHQDDVTSQDCHLVIGERLTCDIDSTGTFFTRTQTFLLHVIQGNKAILFHLTQSTLVPEVRHLNVISSGILFKT